MADRWPAGPKWVNWSAISEFRSLAAAVASAVSAVVHVRILVNGAGLPFIDVPITNPDLGRPLDVVGFLDATPLALTRGDRISVEVLLSGPSSGFFNCGLLLRLY